MGILDPESVFYKNQDPIGVNRNTLQSHCRIIYILDRQYNSKTAILPQWVETNGYIQNYKTNLIFVYPFFPRHTIDDHSFHQGKSLERYEAIKKVFNIDEKRQIRKLSKGMKKQVAFWLSLSAMPDVLILDEPLDGLDPVMRKQVLNLVIADVADKEMTVLVSSHNLRELEDICDWVGIIHKGKMIIEKPLDDLKGNVHKYQVVFGEKKLEKAANLLHISNTGNVYNIILRGDAEETLSQLKKFEPVLCERVSLTLEEVFIYELGGLGYDFKNIIV